LQLADVQVRLGTAEQNTNIAGDSAALSAAGISTLKALAAKHPDSVLILDSEVAALQNVKPLMLRDASMALACAQREALLTKRRMPSVLLSLVQAYRSAGLPDQARETAIEGLALLPPASVGTPTSRARKLLELERGKRGPSK